MSCNVRTMIACALVLFALPGEAFAWGAEGHRIVALIAADRLSPLARTQVGALLDSPDYRVAMEEGSTWADRIKFQRPNTRPWHYVDIEIGSGGYKKDRDCPNDDCIVAQIERDETILRDHRLAQPVRAEALRFLIHFIGDLHQPLHCADNHDRGGNELKVLVGRRSENLHAVWDDNVVQSLGRDPELVASELESQIAPIKVRSWVRGSTSDWANESFHIAEREIFSQLPGAGETVMPVILPRDYASRERPVTAEQLEKAGVRLAAVLNAAFD